MKILLLAYNSPPLYRAGSLRTYSWLEYVPKGDQITMITRKWSNETYNKSNYFYEDIGYNEYINIGENKLKISLPNKHNLYFKLKNNRLIKLLKIQKLFTFFEEVIKYFPVYYFDNQRSLYYASKNYIKKNKVDVIIASGEPFILFKYAYYLSKEFNIPFVLDYRDSWTSQYYTEKKIAFLIKIIRIIQKKFEIKFLKRSLLTSFVSNELFDRITNDLIFDINYYINPNGFKLTEKNLKSSKISNSFEICYTGSIYHKHRVGILLKALEELINEGYKIKITFIGSLLNCPEKNKNELLAFKAKFSEKITIYPLLSNSITLSKQANSNLLIKFNSINQTKHHFGKKLYEYAASNNKVLMINSIYCKNDKINFFDDKPFIYRCDNEKDIKRYICKFYNYWENESWEKLSNKIPRGELKKYSTKNQTKSFIKKIKTHVELNKH